MSEQQAGKLRLLGVGIDCIPISLIVDRSASLMNTDGQIHLACANPHSLVTARSDPEFMSALNRSDIVIADGTGITMVSRLYNGSKPPRITGYDYFHNLLTELDRQKHGRVFFFGSSPQVLAAIESNFADKYPNVTLAGTWSPPYGEWSEQENDEMIAAINAADADVLFVGMTAPKQEKWVERNRERLNVPIIASIGAVFDFFAGTHPRCPGWMHKAGLEWLYRLLREPKRMWRRNFISTPLFLMYVISERIFGERRGHG